MRILLVCAVGMSTSLIVKKMREIAPEGVLIDHGTGAEVQELVDDYDVIMIGPQLRYRKDEIEEIAGRSSKPVGLIDPVTYGRMLGKEILEQAIALVDEKGK